MSLGLRDRVAAGDGAALRAIAEACGNFDLHELDYVPEILTALEADGDASGYRLLVAEDGQGPAAFVIYGPMDEDDSQFDLYWIATHPRVQGQGAGGLLMTACERRAVAEGCVHMAIETEDGAAYAAAHALYRRFGYTVAKTDPDHYGPGRNRLIFAKSLATGPADP